MTEIQQTLRTTLVEQLSTILSVIGVRAGKFLEVRQFLAEPPQTCPKKFLVTFCASVFS